MKIAILADTHFGVRANNLRFHRNNREFFANIFFPTLVDRDIHNAIHVGDVFDERVKIDIHTIKQARQYFFEPLEKFDIHLEIIPGNHDLYWRERDDTSSLKEIVDQYKGINIVESVGFLKNLQHHRPYTNEFLLIPWINQQNRNKSLEIISEANKIGNVIAFGHLELVGYHMYRGQIAAKGDDPVIFNGFKHVYSGHYHHKNSAGNITYLGSNQQHTWADAGDRRGFHIFDTKTHEIEFIENPYDMFAYIDYVDQLDAQGKRDLPFNPDNMYIRVRPDTITKQTQMDAYVKRLTTAGAADVKVMQPKLSVETAEQLSDYDLEQVNDTVQIIRNSVDDVNTRTKMLDLYEKAIAIS